LADRSPAGPTCQRTSKTHTARRAHLAPTRSRTRTRTRTYLCTHTRARVCDVFAIYEQSRTSTRARAGRTRGCSHACEETRARLSARSSLPVPRTQTRARTWTRRSRRENPLGSEAWIIALRAIDASLPIAVRPPARR